MLRACNIVCYLENTLSFTKLVKLSLFSVVVRCEVLYYVSVEVTNI